MRRITVIRRDASGTMPAALPVAQLAQVCDRCRQLAEVRRLAEERRLEISRLQQRIADLEDQLRRARSTAHVVRRLQQETAPAADTSRATAEVSISEIPIADDKERW